MKSFVTFRHAGASTSTFHKRDESGRTIGDQRARFVQAARAANAAVKRQPAPSEAGGGIGSGKRAGTGL